MFLIFSVAVAYWSLKSGLPELPVALLGLMIGLLMAHHRGWVQENQYINFLIKILGQGVVPLGLAAAVLLEIIAPLAMSTQIDEFLASLDSGVQAGIVFAIAAALFLAAKGVEAINNTGSDQTER